MISLGRVRSSSPSQAVVSRQLLPNFYLFTVLYILNVLAMWSMVPTAKGQRFDSGIVREVSRFYLLKQETMES